MKAKHLTPILAVLLLVCTIGVASAATTITIPYTDFNAGMKEHPTGYASDVWSLRLVNSLNFTDASSVAKMFIANSTGANFFAINVNLAPEVDDSTRYSMDFFIATQADPGPENWTAINMLHNLYPGKAYYIRLSNEGELSVTDGNSVLLSSPLDLKFPAVNIRTDGTDAAASGTVQVTVGGWSATPTETVNMWIPIIITFAMLSIVLGMIKKLKL